jgi:hypothetical protein
MLTPARSPDLLKSLVDPMMMMITLAEVAIAVY